MAVMSAVASLAQDPEAKTYAVRTSRPERRTIAKTMVKTGALHAPAQVSLCSKIPGRLATTALDDGTPTEEGVRVKAGEAVARLDDREYRIACDVARAAVAAALAQAEDAAAEFGRVERLRASNVASEQDYDAARFARDRADAALAQASGALAAAELDLQETVIRAPFDGVIATKSLHAGAIVSASSEIFSVVATDPLYALFDVPSSAMPLVKPGVTKVRVTVGAYPDEPFDLVVSEIYPTADTGTRTVRVRSVLPNHDGRCLPGMFATGSFALDEREGVLVVPYEAVLRIRDRHCVYRVVDGRAVLSDVDVGLRHDEVVEIVSGITDGDEIVTDGLHRLTDGAAVKVAE